MLYDNLTLVEPLSARLKKALAIRGMRAIDLSNKTGISESALSHYISGRFEPKQKNLTSIANALNVRPEWLMGLDVPMEEAEFLKAKQEAKLRIYLAKLLKLSTEDQEFIFKQIDLLERSAIESN